MTQEQFNKASELQTKIKDLKDRNEQLKKIIDLLEENSNKGYKNSDIRILINDSWYPIKGTIDFYYLFNFLIQQKVENETKIEEIIKKFEKI